MTSVLIRGGEECRDRQMHVEAEITVMQLQAEAEKCQGPLAIARSW